MTVRPFAVFHSSRIAVCLRRCDSTRAWDIAAPRKEEAWGTATFHPSNTARSSRSGSFVLR